MQRETQHTGDTIDTIASSVKPEDEKHVLEEVGTKVDALEKGKQSGVKELLQSVKLAFRMLKDNEYALSWKTKTLLIAGLMYFLLPSDLTPDYIPIIGYIDDAAVMTAIFKRLAREIQSYKRFRNI